MKPQKAIIQETIHISFGVVVGSIIMIIVYAIIGKLALPVVLGTLLGDATAILNFFMMGLGVQKATGGESDNTKMTIRASYSVRMLFMCAVLIVSVLLDCFEWIPVVVALLLPRLTILFMQVTGIYKRLEERELEEQAVQAAKGQEEQEIEGQEAEELEAGEKEAENQAADDNNPDERGE